MLRNIENSVQKSSECIVTSDHSEKVENKVKEVVVVEAASLFAFKNATSNNSEEVIL